jgi:hypothetical protein
VTWLLLATAVLLLGAVAALPLSGSRRNDVSSVATASVVVAAILGLIPTIQVLAGGPVLQLRLPWPVPFGEFFIELDPLSAWFLVPTLSLSAGAQRTYYRTSPATNPQDYWSAALLLNFPLFTGFSNSYNIQKAKEDAEVARARADTVDQQVLLQVWTSYYAFQTSAQLVRTSHDLLASAEQSERVALGRYKEGVGTIIDLLTAQAALASARSQEIQARSGWYVALAQLAHDTGSAAPLDQPVEITKEGGTP